MHFQVCNGFPNLAFFPIKARARSENFFGVPLYLEPKTKTSKSLAYVYMILITIAISFSDMLIIFFFPVLSQRR